MYLLLLLDCVCSCLGENPCEGHSLPSLYQQALSISYHQTWGVPLQQLLKRCEFGMDISLPGGNLCFRHCDLRAHCLAVRQMEENICQLCFASTPTDKSYSILELSQISVKESILHGNS